MDPEKRYLDSNIFYSAPNISFPRHLNNLYNFRLAIVEKRQINTNRTHFMIQGKRHPGINMFIPRLMFIFPDNLIQEPTVNNLNA